MFLCSIVYEVLMVSLNELSNLGTNSLLSCRTPKSLYMLRDFWTKAEVSLVKALFFCTGTNHGAGFVRNQGPSVFLKTSLLLLS